MSMRRIFDNIESEKDAQRLVYLIHLYTEKGEHGEVTWLKDQALKALIYIGTVEQLFRTFDYAPLFVTWSDQTRFVNVSMEAEAILEKLIEAKIIERLRLSTEHYRYIFAYRVTDRAYVREIPMEIKREVENVYKCPVHSILYEVHFTEHIEPQLICPKCEREKEIIHNKMTKIRARNILDAEQINFISELILLSKFLREKIEV